MRGSNQQSVGGYRYTTGGSPLRKDSPSREVKREVQVYQGASRTEPASAALVNRGNNEPASAQLNRSKNNGSALSNNQPLPNAIMSDNVSPNTKVTTKEETK